MNIETWDEILKELKSVIFYSDIFDPDKAINWFTTHHQLNSTLFKDYQNEFNYYILYLPKLDKYLRFDGEFLPVSGNFIVNAVWEV